MPRFAVLVITALLLALALPQGVWAEEVALPEKCVKCHEWEDWTGLSKEAFIAGTKDKKNKKHKKKLKSLSDDDLAAIIDEILGNIE